MTPNDALQQRTGQANGSRASRRVFLRGLGTALAIPALESALPRSAWASAAQSKPPVRMAMLFVPNGVHMPDWKPTTEGSDFVLPASLEPLGPFRQKLLVLSGLAQDAGFAHGDGPGDHARSAATFLTGVHPVKTDGKGIRAGISVDQIAAEALASQTRFRSLELGMEGGKYAGNCDSGYSCAYSNSISWRTATTPSGKEHNPRLVFERLFGAGDAHQRAASRARRALEQQSLLDLVQDDARRLQGQLAKSDRHKLDEYLTGIREIEKRLDWNGVNENAPIVESSAAQPLAADDLDRRFPRQIPTDFERHFRLMGDLIVLAFRADLTRVVTFMLGNEGSQLTYPSVGVTTGHHTLSHHQMRSENLRQIAQINRFHVAQLAYFLERLQETRDGEGTLLDNSMIVYGSGISDGDRHNHDDLPILLAGGGGGALASGRHLQFPEPTPLMNLYVRMLHIAGISIDSLGDSTAPLVL